MSVVTIYCLGETGERKLDYPEVGWSGSRQGLSPWSTTQPYWTSSWSLFPLHLNLYPHMTVSSTVHWIYYPCWMSLLHRVCHGPSSGQQTAGYSDYLNRHPVIIIYSSYNLELYSSYNFITWSFWAQDHTFFNYNSCLCGLWQCL